MTLQLRSGRGDRLSLTRAKAFDTQTRLCAERRASVANRACNASAALPELYKPHHESSSQLSSCRPQLLFHGRCLEQKHMCHCLSLANMGLQCMSSCKLCCDSTDIFNSTLCRALRLFKTVMEGFEFAFRVTVLAKQFCWSSASHCELHGPVLTQHWISAAAYGNGLGTRHCVSTQESSIIQTCQKIVTPDHHCTMDVCNYRSFKSSCKTGEAIWPNQTKQQL